MCDHTRHAAADRRDDGPVLKVGLRLPGDERDRAPAERRHALAAQASAARMSSSACGFSAVDMSPGSSPTAPA